MLATIIALMMGWRKVFAQQRTTNRAIRQALCNVCVVGRRTIARSYLLSDGKRDWSSEYKLHSRSKWQAQSLFEPTLKAAIALCPGKFLPLASDDTRLRKSGKKIKTAQWGRDPHSPAWRINLQWGLRFLHTSILVPLHSNYLNAVAARALPVWFEEVPPVAKPDKRASNEEKKAYRQKIKQQNLSTQSLEMFKQMRERVDEAGGKEKILAFSLDGSFCNKTIFGAQLERTIVIARTRRDAQLCFPSTFGRSKYSTETFTPEAVLKDAERVWQIATIFHGNRWRYVDYKDVNQLLWRRGGKTRRLRLLVVRPIPYRKTKKGKLLYRNPAYLLTTDLETPAQELLQIYFDRWQIEVAHQELKDSFGLGQAQLRVPDSVARQPALTVATYSTLHLAALQCFGALRNSEIWPLPKYQREKVRISSRDLIRKLRLEMINHQDLLLPFSFSISADAILAAASS